MYILMSYQIDQKQQEKHEGQQLSSPKTEYMINMVSNVTLINHLHDERLSRRRSLRSPPGQARAL